MEALCRSEKAVDKLGMQGAEGWFRWLILTKVTYGPRDSRIDINVPRKQWLNSDKRGSQVGLASVLTEFLCLHLHFWLVLRQLPGFCFSFHVIYAHKSVQSVCNFPCRKKGDATGRYRKLAMWSVTQPWVAVLLHH